MRDCLLRKEEAYSEVGLGVGISISIYVVLLSAFGVRGSYPEAEVLKMPDPDADKMGGTDHLSSQLSRAWAKYYY